MDTTTTDLDLVDAEIVEDDQHSFGKDVAKTAGYSATTIVAVVAAVYAYNYLKPRVASLFNRAKNEAEEVVETVDAPANQS